MITGISDLTVGDKLVTQNIRTYKLLGRNI